MAGGLPELTSVPPKFSPHNAGLPLLLQETLGAGVCYILTFDPFGRSSLAPLTGED